MGSSLPWKALHPFGAEVDLDLAQPISPDTIEALQALYDEHHLLVFRNQKLSHERQIEVVGNFGPPLMSAQDGVGFISNEAGKGGLGGGELAFHSDLSFSPEPFLGISLHAVNVWNDRSSTRFVDAGIAYRTLPETTKSRLAGLTAHHVFSLDFARAADESSPEGLPSTDRPLVMTHPRTGEAILYVNLNQTQRILELEPAESRALIGELFEHLYQPDAVYEHRWQMGDLVLWDNLATQHARGDVSEVGPRTLQRVVLARKGFFEQHPQFRAEEFMS